MWESSRHIRRFALIFVLICGIAGTLLHHSLIDHHTDEHHSQASCGLCVAYDSLGAGVTAAVVFALMLVAVASLTLRITDKRIILSAPRFTIHSSLDPPLA